jgi:hypothetical protein
MQQNRFRHVRLVLFGLDMVQRMIDDEFVNFYTSRAFLPIPRSYRSDSFDRRKTKQRFVPQSQEIVDLYPFEY